MEELAEIVEIGPDPAAAGGESTSSGRPQHPRQDPQVLEAFKKTSLARSQPP